MSYKRLEMMTNNVIKKMFEVQHYTVSHKDIFLLIDDFSKRLISL